MSDQFHHYYQRYLNVAEQGDAEAQYRLGELFYQGENIPANKKDAWMEYKSFGKGAISPTYFKEAVEWERGFKEAARWYLKAAEQGHVKAQYGLGCAYDTLSRLGDPYVHDENRNKYKNVAEEWYQEAAYQGYADAQHALGVFYEVFKDSPGRAAGVVSPANSMQHISGVSSAQNVWSECTA